MTELMTLQMRYDLPPSLAKILLLLVENKVVTARMIELEHRLTKDAKVAIHRLRRRMDATPDVEIKSRRDVGYWMEPASRDAVRRVITADQFELPLAGGGTSGAEAAA